MTSNQTRGDGAWTRRVAASTLLLGLSACVCGNERRPCVREDSVDAERVARATESVRRFEGEVATRLGLARPPFVKCFTFVTDPSDDRISRRGISAAMVVDTREVLIDALGPAALDDYFIAHEMTHAGIRDLERELPTWVEEALCDVVALELNPELRSCIEAARAAGALVATGELSLWVRRTQRTDAADEFVAQLSNGRVHPLDVFGDDADEHETNAEHRGLSYCMLRSLCLANGGVSPALLQRLAAALDGADPRTAMDRLGLSLEPESWRAMAVELVGPREISWILDLDGERWRREIEAEVQRRGWSPKDVVVRLEQRLEWVPLERRAEWPPASTATERASVPRSPIGTAARMP